MGFSGLALSGFVFTHMLGNMLIFKGADAFNLYGHGIVSLPIFPIISYGLLGIFVLHIICAISISYDNKKASPEKYAMSSRSSKASSLASRTMIYTGTVLMAFLVLHLLSFKYGDYIETEINGQKVRDLYALIIKLFHNPLYVLGYIFSLVMIGIHLSHGLSASFQSLGFYHKKYTPVIKCISYIYAVVVAAGFISQPIYVYFFR